MMPSVFKSSKADVTEDEMMDETSESTRLISNTSKSQKELSTNQKLAIQYSSTKKERSKFKSLYSEEKKTTKKLYKSLVALAKELRSLKIERSDLEATTRSRFWYAGDVLPGSVAENVDVHKSKREPTSPTDLFLDGVFALVFFRLGDTAFRTSEGGPDWSAVSYFAVAWQTWCKGRRYATRFDDHDLFCRTVVLATASTLLMLSVVPNDEDHGGGASGHDLDSSYGDKVMKVAAVVSSMYFFLYVRVVYWHSFFSSADDVPGTLARQYAQLNMTAMFVESIVWFVGIKGVSRESHHRWIVFVVGVAVSFGVPRIFLGNDFYAALSNRCLLYTLLLIYSFQKIASTVVDSLDSESPPLFVYGFVGSLGFFLFCLNLLFSNCTHVAQPRDHALLVSLLSEYCFRFFQLLILLSTIIVCVGLNHLTASILDDSTQGSLEEEQHLISGGFSALVGSLFITKNMHIRRTPVKNAERFLFFVTHFIESAAYLTVLLYAALASPSFNEMKTVIILCASTATLVLLSCLDNLLDEYLYGSSEKSSMERTQPSGIFSCMSEVPNKYDVIITDEEVSSQASNNVKRGNSVKFAQAASSKTLQDA